MGLGGDKDVEGFGRELGPLVDTAVLTRSKAMKAVSMERLRLSLGSHPSRIHETWGVAEALEWALDQAGPEDLILITGSFYIISEALAWRRDHPGRFHL
jgi:dihydrofolate synthase/folylpolyglutamate synthase